MESIKGARSKQPSTRNVLHTNCGFTLIELLIVVAVIGILATLALSGFYTIREKARVARATEEIQGLEKDIFAWAAERGTYPPDLAAVNQGNFRDPWGNLYIYKPAPYRKYGIDFINSDFDIYSAGTDGISTDPSLIQPGSPDDIVRGNDGSYTGIANLFGI